MPLAVAALPAVGAVDAGHDHAVPAVVNAVASAVVNLHPFARESVDALHGVRFAPRGDRATRDNAVAVRGQHMVLESLEGADHRDGRGGNGGSGGGEERLEPLTNAIDHDNPPMRDIAQA